MSVMIGSAAFLAPAAVAAAVEEPQVEVVNVMFHTQGRSIVANTANVITVDASQS